MRSKLFLFILMFLLTILTATFLACSSDSGASRGADDTDGDGPGEKMWAWVAGDATVKVKGFYGTMGVADPANVPGARYGAASWTDSGGNLWLFGGWGYDNQGWEGELNDLWKYDGDNWTWVSGSDTVGQKGVYGTKGVADPANMPGGRDNPLVWQDADGNFWLFGGRGYSGNGVLGRLNDLWKFDGVHWTWFSGSAAASQPGVYGTKGEADPANVPGARQGGASWIDSEGSLWLFGGMGTDKTSGHTGFLNDLWKFDGVNWTWISGSDVYFQPGVYGTKGVADAANVPGTRYYTMSWTDSADNLWLFGGWGIDKDSNTGDLNDLWKFDGLQWTWMAGADTRNQPGVYGTMGAADPANTPGARNWSVTWIDSADNLWLFGGWERNKANENDTGERNDLWKYDGLHWTWMAGADATDQPGVYGSKGVPDAANLPGSRCGAVVWKDPSGHVWLFGGDGHDRHGKSEYLNDLWKYDGNHWAWMAGTDELPHIYGTYGTQGVPDAANMPGARQEAVSWTDSQDNLWLFGGWGKDKHNNLGYLNDLWKYDGAHWTWMAGADTPDQSGVYGTKGVAHPANVPGARSWAVTWTDQDNNLWLFGGFGYDNGGYSWQGELNDLWKYDGDNWIWVSGSDIAFQYGVYGTRGVADPANMPGARIGAVSWVDSGGNLWLFGGFGNAEAGGGALNDLWRYDGDNWTWMAGSNMADQPGVYGTKGAADPANVPGARGWARSWIDSDNNLWLFGGEKPGYRCLNDLWKYDGVTWTWMAGADTADQASVYGTKGVSDPANMPGARYWTLSWTDSENNLWLFGGWGKDKHNNLGYLNDQWKFDGHDWTWVAGADEINQVGVYGTRGVPDPANVPGAMYGAVSWTDSDDNHWLFGGAGLDQNGGDGILNSLWRYGP